MDNTDPLKQPKAELAAAERAIAAMKRAATFEEFEAEWRELLNCLEKTWNKVERTCQPQATSFQPWQGTYHRLRRQDPLLRYLKQARDADNHSIQDITGVQPGSQIFRFTGGKGGHIKNMVFGKQGVRHYEGDPITVEIRPPQPIAIRVRNNGEWFNPPATHLDEPVTSLHPVHLAELGLRFYTDFLNQVRAKFFGSAP